MSSRLDAEWIIWRAKADRNMWPAECCAWVASQVAAPPLTDGDALTWLALTLERRTDRDSTVKRLLAALGDAPEGTFTEDDLRAEHRSQLRDYDKWVTDQAHGHGRREGRQQ